MLQRSTKTAHPLPSSSPITRQGPAAVTYHIPSTPCPLPKTTISLPRHSTWTSSLHFHTIHTEHLHLLRGAIFLSVDGVTKILSARAGGSVTNSTNGKGGGEVQVSAGLEVKVERYARHEWGRAREYLAMRRSVGAEPWFSEDVDDDVVVEEWTDPGDSSKSVFFWNLNGVVLAPRSAALPPRRKFARWVLGGRRWVSFQLLVVFWELDNWPVFLDLRGVLGRGMIWPSPEMLRVERVKRKVERVKRKVERWAEWLFAIVVMGVVRILGWVVGVRAVEKERTPVGLFEEYQRKGL